MDAYLTKPFEARELRSLLSNWLAKEDVHAASDNLAPSGTDEQRLPEDVIDHKKFAALKNAIGDHHSQALHLFLDSVAKNADIVRKSLKKNKHKRITNAAHTLKGSSAQFGATSLSLAAAELERAGEHGEWPVIAEKATVFLSAVKALQAIKSQLTDSL